MSVRQNWITLVFPRRITSSSSTLVRCREGHLTSMGKAARRRGEVAVSRAHVGRRPYAGLGGHGAICEGVARRHHTLGSLPQPHRSERGSQTGGGPSGHWPGVHASEQPAYRMPATLKKGPQHGQDGVSTGVEPQEPVCTPASCQRPRNVRRRL